MTDFKILGKGSGSSFKTKVLFQDSEQMALFLDSGQKVLFQDSRQKILFQDSGQQALFLDSKQTVQFQDFGQKGSVSGF